MSDRRLRVGAVRYLNSKPLIAGLDDADTDIELVLDLPSRLAKDLSAGRLDVALIPVVEWLRDSRLTLVGDACVATRGPVWSVKVLFRVPPAEVTTLALDEGSRTSVALARVLLAERFGLEPTLVPFPIGSSVEDLSADAILMIGDRAMRSPPGDLVASWDLGEEWTRETGLPFVFAIWAARPGIPLGQIEAVLGQARDRGVARLDAIARVAGPPVGVTAQQAATYFRDNLDFHLGAAERDGLALFARRAAALGIVPAPREIPRHVHRISL